MIRVNVIIIGAVLIGGQHASAATSATDLAATVASNNPLAPTITLKNISDHACQVAATSEGTVAITRIAQRGTVIQPSIISSSGDEDVGYLLRDQLRTLQPGQSTTIPLVVYKLSSGYVLRSTTWSRDGGTFTTEFSIADKGALDLDANYSLPIAPNGTTPACGSVIASTTHGGISWQLLLGVGIISSLAMIAIVVLLILWRKRRKKLSKSTSKKIKATIIALTFLGLSGWIGNASPAKADVIVPPELQSVYSGCIDTFNANRDITGPILDILNNPANHFDIVHRHSAGSDMTGRPNSSGTGGIFTIYWNPDDHHRYAGSGGYPDACTSLYHELYHALDQLNGTFSREYCAGSGIETKEVMATRAQNQLRVRLGLPARSHYGDQPLPSGDCHAAPRPTSCTGDHCGETNGDPHLRTFDGLRYDFQAAGEFIVARASSEDFEIQARQEPWAESRTVAINTALAFKVGKDRIELRAGQDMALRINGNKRDLSTTALPDGGHIDYEDYAATVTWPDGSIAYIRPVGSYGLALSVQPSDERAGKLEGLLGDADGSNKNDLHIRGSTKTIQPEYTQLYPTFADSWRIDNTSSLFSYDKGTSTATYTNHSFPDKPLDQKTLPGYAAAEAFCKNLGVSDTIVLTNCALDMAITGRPEFARAAARSQVFAAGADFGGTTWRLTIKNPGDSASVTFDAKAGEKVFVQIPVTTLGSQCGSLLLIAPDGKAVSDGCIINGRGEIDGTVLPAAGTYTIKLAPNQSVGTATVRLLRITDLQGSVTPDGPSVNTTIDRPGVVARYTFNAEAGQRAYLAIPSSTLDSSCGTIRFTDSGGHEISSGCIINHVGYIDTTVLPDTGQYTIVIDPNDTSVGRAQLKLIFPTTDTKPISVDGTTQSITLSKPGSTAVRTFDGRAGQRIYIDLPTSSLPSQCGLLGLKDPNGTELASGCVINGKGNLTDDGFVLPTTGAYSITLNPNGGDTGTTTIRVRSH